MPNRDGGHGGAAQDGQKRRTGKMIYSRPSETDRRKGKRDEDEKDPERHCISAGRGRRAGHDRGCDYAVVRPASYHGVHQTPAGMFIGSRSILRGVFSAFHFDSAFDADAKAGRRTNLPRPGCGWLFWPWAQTISPRESV